MIAIAITALVLSFCSLVCVICCIVGSTKQGVRTNEKWECPRCKSEAIGLYQGEWSKYSYYHIICPNCQYEEDVLFQHEEESQ